MRWEIGDPQHGLVEVVKDRDHRRVVNVETDGRTILADTRKNCIHGRQRCTGHGKRWNSVQKEVNLLGRQIRWHEWGLTWEGDERHRKIVIDFFGKDENSKKLMQNGYKDDDVKDATDSQELDIQECKSYRMLAARSNFIAQDNPAIQYSAKEICRNMARPETTHSAKIKKLARFLLDVKTVKWE